MRKVEQEVEQNFRIATGGKEARKPYSKPRLVKHGKLADLTRGQGGTKMDPGHTSPTKKGTG